MSHWPTLSTFSTLIIFIISLYRGAELINSILIKDVLKQKEDEKIVLYNIKKKMEVLKKKQAHKKKDFIEPDEHFQGKVFQCTT